MKNEITTHTFEDAIAHIKNFSNNIEADVVLSKVDFKDGQLIKFDHKVTGKELNTLISQLQRYIQAEHGRTLDIIREFGEVYKALNSLDKDYIDGIKASVKLSERNSFQAEKLSNEVFKNQMDIKKEVELHEKTIDIFNDKITKINNILNVKGFNNNLFLRSVNMPIIGWVTVLIFLILNIVLIILHICGVI